MAASTCAVLIIPVMDLIRPAPSPSATPGNISASSAAWHYSYDAMGHQIVATPPFNAYKTLAATNSNHDLGGAGRLSTVTPAARAGT